MKKVLVILGHPRLESYCNALSQAYERGAKEAGAEVRRLDLARLEFDPIFKLESDTRFSGEQGKGLEPDLIKAQQDIVWADHLVFVYPSWWGSFPTLLKGFIDRTFTPGFAFKYHQGKTLPEQLLKGKTARLIVTMDTPSWWNRFVYRAAGHNAMRHATLFLRHSPCKNH
jgi:NAD(P)H dehydrogenase (quinone)